MTVGRERWRPYSAFDRVVVLRMSGHRSPYGSSRHPRSSNTGPSSALASAASAWEDDAWKIDSDDEEFVKASRMNANPASPSTPAVNRLTMLSTNGKAASSTRVQDHPGLAHADLSKSEVRENHKEGAGSGQWTIVDGKMGGEEISPPIQSSKEANGIDAAGLSGSNSSYPKTSPRQSKNRELEHAIRDDFDHVLKGESVRGCCYRSYGLPTFTTFRSDRYAS